MNNRIKKIIIYLIPFALVVALMALFWPKPATAPRQMTTTAKDTATGIPEQAGEQYTAMLDSTQIEGNLVAQLPNDTELRPMRIVDGKPALVLENSKIVVMANGQTGQVTVANGKLAMQLRDSSTQELSFKKDGIAVGGKETDDARMAVMLQGKMLDVTTENGKSFVTLPDSSKMELRVNNGQTMLVAADTLKSRASRLRMPNGTLQRVRIDSGKVRLQVQPDKVIELKRKSPSDK
jgi:RNase P/RNase MRP subunit p29